MGFKYFYKLVEFYDMLSQNGINLKKKKKDQVADFKIGSF